MDRAQRFPAAARPGYECDSPVMTDNPAPVVHEPARMPLRRRLPGAAALLGLFAAHVLLASYFDPPEVLFGAQPVSGSDYDTHIEQTWRVLEGLQGWGQSWVYDVRLLAGHPNGVIFDADNKGWELLTYALVSLGMPKPWAFNSFLLLAHLLVVPIVHFAARSFGLERRAAWLAALLGSWLWLFDSYLHWIWWVGTLAFAFASYFFLLPLAFFYRYTQHRRTRDALGCAISLALAHLIHPYSFFVLVVPLGVLYVRNARAFGAREQLSVAAIIACTLAVNGEWLLRSLQHWHYILDSGFFGQAGVEQLAADFFGVVLDTSTTGILATRTSVRTLCLAAGIVTLLHYRKVRDPRLWPVAAGLAFMLALTYLGGYSKLAHQIQPYRFAGAAAFLAALPAADLLTLLSRELAGRALTGLQRGALCVLGLLALQHVGGEALSYFPSALPQVPPLLDELQAPITATGYPPFIEYRHVPDHPALWELPKWVDAQAKAGSGRVLVQNSALGEQLAWKTEGEILGGFVLRNLQHAYANLFRRRLERHLTPGQVRAYLEAYAVEWVVLSFPDPWFEKLPELFAWHGTVGGNMVLRTKVPISRFQRGSGQVTARTNELHVTHSDPAQDLVLRYHFHEALGCSPQCRVLPARNPVGGVPFIHIPAPHPAELRITNTYRMQR